MVQYKGESLRTLMQVHVWFKTCTVTFPPLFRPVLSSVFVNMLHYEEDFQVEQRCSTVAVS